MMISCSLGKWMLLAFYFFRIRANNSELSALHLLCFAMEYPMERAACSNLANSSCLRERAVPYFPYSPKLYNCKSDAMGKVDIDLLRNLMNSSCHHHSKHRTSKIRVWITVQVKNEAQTVIEWLVWHFLLGVEHAVVYDNGSTDNLKEALQPFESVGLVEVVDMPGIGVVANSYTDAVLRARKAKATWLAAIDADEYIVPLLDSCIPQFLHRYHNNSHVAAVRLNWHMTTALGRLLRYENGIMDQSFIIDRTGFYSGRADDHIKSIVKVPLTTKYIDCHYAAHTNHTYGIAPDTRKKGTYHFTKPPEIKTAVLLHAHVRTLEEWIMKRQRGFPDRKELFCPYCNATLEILTAEWQCVSEGGYELSIKNNPNKIYKCKDNPEYVPLFNTATNFEWPNNNQISQVLKRQSVLMHSVIAMPIQSTIPYNIKQ